MWHSKLWKDYKLSFFLCTQMLKRLMLTSDCSSLFKVLWEWMTGALFWMRAVISVLLLLSCFAPSVFFSSQQSEQRHIQNHWGVFGKRRQQFWLRAPRYSSVCRFSLQQGILILFVAVGFYSTQAFYSLSVGVILDTVMIEWILRAALIFETD